MRAFATAHDQLLEMYFAGTPDFFFLFSNHMKKKMNGPAQLLENCFVESLDERLVMVRGADSCLAEDAACLAVEGLPHA